MTPAAGAAGRSQGAADRAAGAVVTALAAAGTFWFVPAYTNTAPTTGNDIAPALVPLVCTGLALLLGLAMLWRGCQARPAAAAPAGADPEAGAASAAGPREIAADLAVWAGSTVAIMLLLPRAGFILTGALLLAGWMAYAGVRQRLVAAAVVLVLPAAIDRLCWYALTVQLP